MKFRICWSLLLALILISKSGETPAAELDLSWAHEKPWLKLLHYQDGKSTIDGGDFFFATDGRKNPEAEAVAFIKALKENKIVGPRKQTTYCAFPERTRFVREKTKVFLSEHVLQQTCDLYNDYIAQFHDPQKISLVFSSAYPNNPASMFGHTFLKIHSKRQTDLLDVGLNYAASVSDNENPFAFFWFGVTGGYRGRWSIEPYYVKVQDYVKFESRDLWEYEIDWTPFEVRRFLDHIWEVENNSYSDYYFFDENCSYQILASIEAIRPEWNLLTYKIYVIPGESVKFLMNEPTAIREVRYRPSLLKKAQSSYELISTEEKEKYVHVLKTQSVSELKYLSVQALDTMLVEMELKRNQDKEFEKSWLPFQTSLRVERASRGLSDSKANPTSQGRASRVTRPDYGHDSYTFESGTGFKKVKSASRPDSVENFFASFKIKTAYHDLLNSDQGFSQFSEIDFPWAEFTLESKNKFRIQELGAIETISLSPINHFKSPVSFKAKFAMENYEDDLHQFYYLNGQMGFGAATDLGHSESRIYVLGIVESEMAPQFEKGNRLLPGFELGALNDFSNFYKVQLLLKYKCDLVKNSNCEIETEYQLNQSIFLSKNHEIRNTNALRQYFFETKLVESKFSFSYLYFFN